MVSEIFTSEKFERSLKIPQGWIKTSLGDIVSFEYGKSLPEEKRDQNGSIPVYGSSGIVGVHSFALIEKPCIIVGRKGGAGAIFLSKSSCYPIDTTYYIIPSDNLDLTFLFFLLKYLRLGRLDRSTAIPGLNRNDAYQLFIPLPPLPEQHRIVAKIEELFTQLDAGVASLKKAQAQLKRYRQAVLKAAFEGRLTQEWREEHKGEIEPADVLFGKIKKEHQGVEKEISKRLPLDNAELFEIPDQWMWIQAQDVCETISNGYTPSADKLFQDSGEIPFIKVYNLTKTGAFDFTIKPTFISRETHETELRRSAVHPDDVLMSIVGPPMGKISLVPELYDEWNINQAIVVFRTFPEYSRKLMLYVLLSETIQKWLQKRGKTTAGQTNYTITMSRSLPIPLPPLDEQPIIVEEIERHFSQIDHLENIIETSLRQVESLRQSILKRAFDGKLVPQDPNDEPASALLERIRAEKTLHATERKKGKALQPQSPKKKVRHAQ